MVTKGFALFVWAILAATSVQVQSQSSAVAVSSNNCQGKCDLFAQTCINNECACITDCPGIEGDTVCTNGGKQYPSRCEFYRNQCLCRSGSSQCKNRGVESEFILFYGICSNRRSRSPTASARLCQNYNNRLAKMVGKNVACQTGEYANAMSEINTTSRNPLNKYMHIQQAQRYTSGIMSDYTKRLFKHELKMYSSLDANEQSMSRTVIMHGQSTPTYDPKLLTLWFCSLDNSADGRLDEGEQAQIMRILVPACPCIEDFLANCRGDDTVITLPELLGDNCFRVPANNQVRTCEALRLNPSTST